MHGPVRLLRLQRWQHQRAPQTLRARRAPHLPQAPQALRSRLQAPRALRLGPGFPTEDPSSLRSGSCRAPRGAVGCLPGLPGSCVCLKLFVRTLNPDPTCDRTAPPSFLEGGGLLDSHCVTASQEITIQAHARVDTSAPGDTKLSRLSPRDPTPPEGLRTLDCSETWWTNGLHCTFEKLATFEWLRT